MTLSRFCFKRTNELASRNNAGWVEGKGTGKEDGGWERASAHSTHSNVCSPRNALRSTESTEHRCVYLSNLKPSVFVFASCNTFKTRRKGSIHSGLQYTQTSQLSRFWKLQAWRRHASIVMKESSMMNEKLAPIWCLRFLPRVESDPRDNWRCSIWSCCSRRF